MPVLSTPLFGQLAETATALTTRLQQLVIDGTGTHPVALSRKNLAIVTLVIVPTVAGIGSIVLSHVRARRILKRLAIVDKEGKVTPVPRLPTTVFQRVLTGHVGDLIGQEDIPRYQAKLLQQHGPVYQSFHILGAPRITLADPKALYAVFSSRSYQFLKHEDVSKGIAFMAGDHGLLVIEGDEHRFHRRTLNPIFNLKLLKSLAPIMDHAFDELETIIDQTHGAPTDFQTLSTAVTLNVIGRTMLATDFDALGPTPSPLNAAYSVLVTVLEFSLWNVFKDAFPILQSLPIPANQRMAQAQKTVWGQIETMIARSSLASTTTDVFAAAAMSDGAQLSSALVAKLLEEAQKDSGLSSTAVRDELLTFLLAGHETSSNLLGMIAFYLAKYPQTQVKLHAALAAHDPAEDLSKCQYLNWVINEALRLHSPAYITMRTAASDMDVEMSDGRVLRVAKGTDFFIPIQAIHLNPAVWGDDAEDFRPERWAHYVQTSDVTSADLSSPNVRVLHPYQFMPFLGGPRQCIGKQMALMTVRMLTSRLVRRYKMSLPAGSELKTRQRPKIDFTITAKASKVDLCFERR